ncbi:MAG: general secretion pathway protein GspK [Candidatus Omnitrophica bacterium]|nr:general secretion pathway protein GspK [Candidatus Omnitrophota bacterium]
MQASRKGSILIIAIWSICFLSTIAVALGVGVRQKLRLIQRLDERDRLYLVADAGVKRAIAELRKGKDNTFDSFRDICADNPGVFQQIDIGGGQATVGYDLPDELSGKQEIFYAPIDESRKINLNTADKETLERLFRIVLGGDEMEAQDLAASVIDWRDADSELSSPLGSAEDSHYRNLNTPYEAKDMSFEILDELGMVKGVNAQSFNQLMNYVTVYGDGLVNVNTASRAVLLALGLNMTITDKILSYRYGKDAILGTDDDNTFDSPAEIIPKLSQFSSLSESELARFSQVVGRLGVQSGYFMLRVTARLNKRPNALNVVAVVQRSGKVVYWHEI